METLDKAHECHNNSPANHYQWQPPAGAHLFQQQIARNLKECVGEEEDCKTPVVLARRHVEVFLKAFDFGIANVSPWVQWVRWGYVEWQLQKRA